jgi:hypothetical protein
MRTAVIGLVTRGSGPLPRSHSVVIQSLKVFSATKLLVGPKDASIRRVRYQAFALAIN